MAKKSYLEKKVNRKIGGIKRSAKSKVGLRKSNKGCLVLLLFMISSFVFLSFISFNQN
jgi:hypothetical protein